MLVANKELQYPYIERDFKEETKTSQRIKKKQGVKAIHKLLIIVIAVIGLALSLLILYRYAGITNMRLEIIELEKQKYEMEKEKGMLIAELETIKSSPRVEEEAILKLGMDYPTIEQVVYLDVDQMEEMDQYNAEEETIFLKRLKNIASLVLNLF